MKRNDLFIHAFLLLCIGFLVVGYLFLLNEVKKVREQKTSPQKETIIQQVISKIIETPTPAASPTIVPTSKPQVAKADNKKITYLNFNGNFTTSATDWIDVVGSDILVDLVSEYGESAYVDWEAMVGNNLDGNQVSVRLFDTTNKIAVNGSELSSNKVGNVRVSSARLYMWRGQNNYRVQIKSLNGQNVNFLNGRIKIVY